MPQILDRDEDNAKRKQRLAKLKRGPGVFVYDGSHTDHESIPTYLLVGKEVAKFNESTGLPQIDKSGRQVFERAGTVVRNGKGEPVLGGVPKIERIAVETKTVRGVDFPTGKKVLVEDPSLALKLRGMDGFEEVEGEADVEAEPEASAEAPKARRGRKPKAAVETEPEASAEE